MLRISSSKINDIVKDIDGAEIEGIEFQKADDIKGLMVTFNHNSNDEELAKDAVKKYLKKKFPVLRIYVEVV